MYWRRFRKGRKERTDSQAKLTELVVSGCGVLRVRWRGNLYSPGTFCEIHTRVRRGVRVLWWRSYHENMQYQTATSYACYAKLEVLSDGDSHGMRVNFCSGSLDIVATVAGQGYRITRNHVLSLVVTQRPTLSKLTAHSQSTRGKILEIERYTFHTIVRWVYCDDERALRCNVIVSKCFF